MNWGEMESLPLNALATRLATGVPETMTPRKYVSQWSLRLRTAVVPLARHAGCPFGEQVGVCCAERCLAARQARDLRDRPAGAIGYRWELVCSERDLHSDWSSRQQQIDSRLESVGGNRGCGRRDEPRMLRLRCRAHNLHDARKTYGDDLIDARIEQRRARGL